MPKLNVTVQGIPVHPATSPDDLNQIISSENDMSFDEFPLYWPHHGYEGARRVLPDGRVIVHLATVGTWSTPF